MKVFKENILFSWGEIYLGLKKQWISTNDVFVFCTNDKINKCNDERKVQLYLSFDESLYDFYNKIKKFIQEDYEPIIIRNEDKLERDFNYIPLQYWNVWKLEFLLRIESNDDNIEHKLIEIADCYREFNFPSEWKSFIYYQPNEITPPIGNIKLYERFISYLKKMKESFLIMRNKDQ